MKRKIRKVSSSIIITIPSQLAKAYGYEPGDELEVEVNRKEIIYRKIWE